MRAIRFEAFGDPSALKAVNVPEPIAHAKTAVVRVMAASINPSDVKNVAGAMSQTKAPRIPGRDFAGGSRLVHRSGSAPKFGARAAILALPATEPTLRCSPCRSRAYGASPKP